MSNIILTYEEKALGRNPIHLYTRKCYQIQVRTSTENPQTLLNQCLWVFTCHIVYTGFYARS